MPRKKAELKCPKCQRVGAWTSTRDINASTLERWYRCDPCTHEFVTVERIKLTAPDAFVLDPMAKKPRRFDEQFIEQNLHNHLKKLLTTDQRGRVTQIVLVDLPEALPGLTPIADHNFGDVTGETPVFTARDIRQVVQGSLRQATREADPALNEQFMAAEAMYRLTELDIDIVAYAKWLQDRFGLKGPLPNVRKNPNPPEIWRPPAGQPPQPNTVVKNFRETALIGSDDDPALIPDEDRAAVRPRREHVPYISDQFRESISNAIGRDRHGQMVGSAAGLARLVQAWVLWSCHGQSVVRSSQLAAYTAGVLRRAAPVAYLRWTLLGKELRVRELFEEARSLIESPPDRLQLEESTSQRGLRSPR